MSSLQFISSRQRVTALATAGLLRTKDRCVYNLHKMLIKFCIFMVDGLLCVWPKICMLILDNIFSTQNLPPTESWSFNNTHTHIRFFFFSVVSQPPSRWGMDDNVLPSATTTTLHVIIIIWGELCKFKVPK